MATNESLQQQQAQPFIWFEEVDWDRMANELKETLQNELAEQLSGELGAEIAAGMEVEQFETYSVEGDDEQSLDPPRPVLASINEKLNEELRLRLVENYPDLISRDEAKFVRVRGLKLQTAASFCSCSTQRCPKPGGGYYTCKGCGSCN